MAVAAVMRTCGRFPSFQTFAKLGKTGSLHQKICPNIGHYSWSRFAKALGPTHSIPCAYQRLWGNKRSIFSVAFPDWGGQEVCADFQKQHSHTLIIRSFPSEQLVKWAKFDTIPHTQLKIRMGAMSSLDSANELRRYLMKAAEEYQTFDFQTFSRYSNNKNPFIVSYSTALDILLVSPANNGFLGNEPQVAICEGIPLDQIPVDAVVNMMRRFNGQYPFSLGLNK